MYTRSGALKRFCRGEDNEDVSAGAAHDPFAPTIHNAHCDGRSVWSVIDSCQDLKGKSSPFAFAEMSVKVMRKTHRNIVLAIDTSEGMKKPAQGEEMSFARFEAVNKAATQFIRSFSSDTQLGICTFNEIEVVTMATLEKVFDKMVERLPKREKVGGRAKMAVGVERALQLLNGRDGEIIVIVNDVEGGEASLNKLLRELETKNVLVHVIALGPAGAERGKRIADATGGKFIFTPAAPRPPEQIIVGLQDALLEQFQELQDEVVTILSGHFTLRNEELIIPFNVESSTGNFGANFQKLFQKVESMRIFMTCLSGEVPTVQKIIFPDGTDEISSEYGFKYNAEFKRYWDTNIFEVLISKPLSKTGLYNIVILPYSESTASFSEWKARNPRRIK
ncbi:Oidioi.mRNA.OKI2018_I69.XSR.g13344.t1.cds [Oikopleura dioica]|uniref:Oidioi.mRNA.OKI2018_I69.XSR.g13344.t1.cds n=1 Tax=Oikopleura dioica TaxID=34765 RepID=A0ABN7SAA4_OIKDI|nr:Oidioi.mRNA.OKI2018_I69.XSR.g13344.t1.cds [Oikopleura dioica]